MIARSRGDTHPALLAQYRMAGIHEDVVGPKVARDMWKAHWEAMQRDTKAAIANNERCWRGDWAKSHFDVRHALFDIAWAVKLMPLQTLIVSVGQASLPAPRPRLLLTYQPA